jgi:hypothetical protein
MRATHVRCAPPFKKEDLILILEDVILSPKKQLLLFKILKHFKI